MDSQVLGAFLVAAGLLILAIVIAVLLGVSYFESPQKRAGRQGEKIASKIIWEILNPGDILLTNVQLSAEGQHTELDNVILNRDGVFIIEVKNYSGTLIGGEEDARWIKNKITSAGSFYQKRVKNPIKQVKRQVYILSRYLKENGIDVWIEGYEIINMGYSPCKNCKP